MAYLRAFQRHRANGMQIIIPIGIILISTRPILMVALQSEQKVLPIGNMI